MRDDEGYEELQHFEKYLVAIASRCEFNYGAMGKVGFLYESIKDQLKWFHLKAKDYAKLISQIGQIITMQEKDYKKQKAKATKMDSSSIAEALIAAFGDGK